MASNVINEAELRGFLATSDEEINQITQISNFEKYDDPTNFDVCNELVQLIKNQLNKVGYVRIVLAYHVEYF